MSTYEYITTLLWCSLMDNMTNIEHLGTLLASHVLLGDVKIQLMRDLLTVRLALDIEEDVRFKQVMRLNRLVGSAVQQYKLPSCSCCRTC